MTATEIAEVAPFNSTKQGVAFEINIKSPKGASLITPVRERLEGRAAEEKPLPRLLFSAHEKQQVESPVKCLAEKVKAENERKRAVLEKTKCVKDEQLSKQRSSLEECLKRADETRRTSLAKRSEKAGKHFEEVKVKCGDCQTQVAKVSQEHLQRLEEELKQKDAVHAKTVEVRKTKAEQHNEQVAEKSKKVQEKLKERAETLNERLKGKACRQFVRQMDSTLVKPSSPVGGSEAAIKVDSAAIEVVTEVTTATL